MSHAAGEDVACEVFWQCGMNLSPHSTTLPHCKTTVRLCGSGQLK